MMLIKRWKEMNDSEILKEIQMLFLNFSNALNLFTVDENHEPIVYCADHSGNTEIETRLRGEETSLKFVCKCNRIHNITSFLDI